MATLNTQQPLLYSSVAYDPSEIILKCCFGAYETFLIINAKNSSALFLCKLWYLF